MKSRGVSSPIVDHVIGAFPRDGLSAALAATHRAGFGPQTRVIDGARGDISKQLARAGLRVPDEDAPPGDGVLIVVTAPGRTAVVAGLFARLGAESVVLAARREGDDRSPDRSASMAPDIRIGDGAGTASEV